ncbi:Protein Shroom4 [Toxocara canis]|uniref:Protein Shroom4 n=1 Tax=Toxocara canis TaxID=6265 RepID=A0A0B2VCY2_TOXCA|nr:Protein Shroom4 [Toxocara canis]
MIAQTSHFIVVRRENTSIIFCSKKLLLYVIAIVQMTQITFLRGVRRAPNKAWLSVITIRPLEANFYRECNLAGSEMACCARSSLTFDPAVKGDWNALMQALICRASHLLHPRSPTRWLKATSSSNMDHHSTPTDGGYRSLIDSGAYKSILPDEPPLTLTQPPPRPPTKLCTPLSCSLTSLNSTTSSTISAASSAPPTSIPSSSFSGGKPMVEVHPMPSQQYTDTTFSPKDCPQERLAPKTKEKPRVPKKPPNLVLNSSSRLNSPSLNALSLSSTSLNIPFTPLTPSQSSPSMSRLFTTPSLMCLHTALMQPGLSEEEVEKVEAKRQKLIESLSKKIDVLDKERVVLEGEIESNEALKNTLIDELTLAGCIDVIERMHINLAHNAQLIRLETKLRMQVERLEGMVGNNMEGIDKDAHAARMERVKGQISDQSTLREAFDRRDARLDALIESRISTQSIPQWRFYKEAWRKLKAEQQEIDERLQLAREQLIALQNVHASL